MLDIDVRKDPKAIAFGSPSTVAHGSTTQERFQHPCELQTPDPRAVVIATYNSGWRILRADFAPDGDGRLAIPSSADRSTTETALRSVWASADAKTLHSTPSNSWSTRSVGGPPKNSPRRRTLRGAGAGLAHRARGRRSAWRVRSRDDLIATFAVDGAQVQGRLLVVFKIARPQAPAKQKFADDVLRYMERAAHDGEFGLARSLAEALDKYLGTTAGDTRREVRARETEYELYGALKAPAPRTKRKADGPDAANSESRARAAKYEGLYRAVALRDWAEGSALLAGGDDPSSPPRRSWKRANSKPASKCRPRPTSGGKLPRPKSGKNSSGLWPSGPRIGIAGCAAAVAEGPRDLDRRKTQIAQLRKASGAACGPRRPLDAVKIGERWYKFYSFAVTQAIRRTKL